MLSTSSSRLRSRLTAALAGMLVLFTANAHANAKGQGSRASLIITSDSGNSKSPGPIVRDHRPQVRDHRGGEARIPPRRPICAGWFC
jgi:hypothetical protein